MERKFREDIRNVAVIAHVDHGKTTLIDSMLRQSGLLSERGEVVERILDSFDQERERGITILAKNASVFFGGTKINILDTPGHHDFGGEVERTLFMADGVLLLVDAAEGPMPQTRFVLLKALELGLPAVVAINKIDRRDARCEAVLNEIYDLFIDLGASDEQIDFPVIYANGRAGLAHGKPGDGSKNLTPLFEAILRRVPPPEDRRGEPLKLLVSNLGWDDYVGRLVLGRIRSGKINCAQTIVLIDEKGEAKTWKVTRLYSFKGLDRVEVEEASSGDIVALAGIEKVDIGDTVADSDITEPLGRIKVEEPTLAMNFCVNTGPFAGRDGCYVTSRKIGERLFREDMANVAIRVEETQSSDIFRVTGRGELQLSVLVETMRREGYELMLSRPEAITRTIEGKLHEPRERLSIDIPQEMLGKVNENLGRRKGKLLEQVPTGARVRVVFSIPSRGLIGFHSEFMTETRGMGVMHASFEGWIPWQGPILSRRTGSLVADRMGTATPYALFNLQPRGVLHIPPGAQVYEGMVVGEHTRSNDLNVNVTREKKLTNIRAAARDENVTPSPPRLLTLEESIEFIAEDEYVEVTPKTIRLRKKILNPQERPKKEKSAGDSRKLGVS